MVKSNTKTEKNYLKQSNGNRPQLMSCSNQLLRKYGEKKPRKKLAPSLTAKNNVVLNVNEKQPLPARDYSENLNIYDLIPVNSNLDENNNNNNTSCVYVDEENNGHIDDQDHNAHSIMSAQQITPPLDDSFNMVNYTSDNEIEIFKPKINHHSG